MYVVILGAMWLGQFAMIRFPNCSWVRRPIKSNSETIGFFAVFAKKPRNKSTLGGRFLGSHPEARLGEWPPAGP